MIREYCRIIILGFIIFTLQGYSHKYSIPSGQTIVSATLTVGVYWERYSSSGSDHLRLDDLVNGLADGTILDGSGSVNGGVKVSHLAEQKCTTHSPYSRDHPDCQIQS